MANKRNLLLLFDRPLEPVFMEKGLNGNVVFDVPNKLLTDRYKNDSTITSRFGENSAEHISVASNISIPNLSVPMQLDRQEQFSLFIPRHRKIAGHLINIFMGKRWSLFEYSRLFNTSHLPLPRTPEHWWLTNCGCLCPWSFESNLVQLCLVGGHITSSRHQGFEFAIVCRKFPRKVRRFESVP